MKDLFDKHRGIVERFQREIRVAASLQHPNILGIIDAGALVRAFYADDAALLPPNYYVLTVPATLGGGYPAAWLCTCAYRKMGLGG